jgi:hypothetical protein
MWAYGVILSRAFLRQRLENARQRSGGLYRGYRRKVRLSPLCGQTQVQPMEPRCRIMIHSDVLSALANEWDVESELSPLVVGLAWTPE